MANIIVDDPKTVSPSDGDAPRTTEQQLVSWIMERVNRWRQYRDNAFSNVWGEYYRLWRGRWNKMDKNRMSERSKIITPALSQAIDMTVAEMEEATFGREQWFDLLDDVDADQPDAILQIRDRLTEDMDLAGVPDSIAGAFLNGALYGNGIGKIIVKTKIMREPGELKEDGTRDVIKSTKVVVKVDPVPADEFVPDPSATIVDEMSGMAHELVKPLSWVRKLQTSGVFRDVPIRAASDADQHKNFHRADLEGSLTNEDAVFVTEYHGLVPASMMPSRDEVTPVDQVIAAVGGEEAMVEAIVTIGNKGTLLRAIPNPFLMKDRAFVSYQHDRVPGRFWGRGVAEKGWNPQKALDSEMRARMDATALIANPMMGADITRLPRGFDLRVRPGKLWLTNGAPKDVLMPVQFANLDPTTFNQSGELERMVQMGTGATDTATPIRQNERNSTATGSSLIASAFVKRSKRAIRNVTNNFLQPLIKKITWRYMQFDAERYPFDPKFQVIGTLGIVARELEQANMTTALGFTKEGTQVHAAVLKALFDSMNTPHKAEINRALDATLAPPPEEERERARALEDLQIQLTVAEADAKINKLQSEAVENQAQAVKNIADAQATQAATGLDAARLNIEVERLFKELGELQEQSRQNDAALINARANLLKARGGASSNNTGES